MFLEKGITHIPEIEYKIENNNLRICTLLIWNEVRIAHSLFIDEKINLFYLEHLDLSFEVKSKSIRNMYQI